MMKLSEEARKEFEAAMERRYGITRDVLYAEGVENRMRRAYKLARDYHDPTAMTGWTCSKTGMSVTV